MIPRVLKNSYPSRRGSFEYKGFEFLHAPTDTSAMVQKHITLKTITKAKNNFMLIQLVEKFATGSVVETTHLYALHQKLVKPLREIMWLLYREL